MPKYHVINYDTFLPRLVEGLRKAWEEVRRQRPGETFYMFGIATDSDVVVLTPFWNTEEKYVAEGNLEYPIEKWVVPEHGYGPCKYTKSLQDEVNRYFHEVMQGRVDTDIAFQKRKARLLKIFEQALVQLDMEGFFGKGDKRHQVLLMIDRGDADEDEERYMLQVIKRINPRQSTAGFFAALKAQQKENAAEKREQEGNERPIKALATAFLRREKRTYDRWLHASRVHTVTPYLLEVLGEETTPDELWEVCYEAKNEPNGSLHGPGVLLVLVNPATGNCVIAP